jgi:hypothetical protein
MIGEGKKKEFGAALFIAAYLPQWIMAISAVLGSTSILTIALDGCKPKTETELRIGFSDILINYSGDGVSKYIGEVDFRITAKLVDNTQLAVTSGAIGYDAEERLKEFVSLSRPFVTRLNFDDLQSLVVEFRVNRNNSEWFPKGENAWYLLWDPTKEELDELSALGKESVEKGFDMKSIAGRFNVSVLLRDVPKTKNTE